jgi:mutator protein MutT
MKQIDVAIAIVSRAGDVLVCQRRPDGPLGGYWEFPGGKREPGETIAACLVRELREELGVDVRPVALLTTIEHDYPHARVRLHPFVCVLEPGSPDPRPIACQAAVWVEPPGLRGYRFPPANDALLDEAIAYFAEQRSERDRAPR